MLKIEAISTVKQSKAQPFGAHFTTKLTGVNSKLVCALSASGNTCTDDPPPGGGGGGGPRPPLPV